MNENMTLNQDKKIATFVLLKRIFKYIIPELPKFLLAIFLILLNVGLDVILPLFISNITNSLKTLNESYNYILILSISYLLISIVNQIILYFDSMVLQRIGQRIIYKLRLEVFSHIESLSQEQFDQMSVGSLVTRVCNYTTSMSDLFTEVLIKLIKNIITVISVFIIMLSISFKLSSYLSIFVVIIFISSFIFSKTISNLFRNERKYISELNTYLNENLSGMKIIQIFNQEKRKKEEFEIYNENLRKARFKVVIAFGIYRPFISLIQTLATAFIFYMGIKLKLTAGEIVAFYLYISKFFNPIQTIADQLNNLQKGLTASEKLFNLTDVKPNIINNNNLVSVESFKGEIIFENVWFAYKKEEWILKDVSFKINAGTSCAFVGTTGAGKTTILGLLVRNYEPQKGRILIDGIDIKKLSIETLRSKIGQMLQDVFLFSGTIRSNIILNDDDFKEEEIKAACDYVNASWFIDKLPNKYDEEVIERGANLSQGEKQLLSFARTIFHKPEILILDEATSNIDTETEVLIQESLIKMKSIGTMIIVAHRLSTIQHVDKIICLSNGCVEEEGTHQELLKKKGYYYKLYLLQFNN